MLICTDVLFIQQDAGYSENWLFYGGSLQYSGDISKPDVPVFCDKTNKDPVLM